MAQEIVSVDEGSLASLAGIRAGDALLRINGETVVDLLDYEALCANGARAPSRAPWRRRDGI